MIAAQLSQTYPKFLKHWKLQVETHTVFNNLLYTFSATVNQADEVLNKIDLLSPGNSILGSGIEF